MNGVVDYSLVHGLIVFFVLNPLTYYGGYKGYKGIERKVLSRKPVLKDAKFISFSNVALEELNKTLEQKQIRQEYMDCVRYFIKKVGMDASHFDLHAFQENLKDLKIQKAGISRFWDSAMAYYHFRKNSIVFNAKDFLHHIFHELFHAASFVKRGKVNASGFYQYDRARKTSFGFGLNEGYTDLLSSRYFPEYFTDGYTIEMYFARFLESIVGQKKMETLYSRADLVGLVGELSLYQSRDNVMKFLKNMDFILLNKDKYFSKGKCRKSILEVCTFLGECYSNKQHMMVEKRMITEKQCEQNTKQYFYQLYKGINFLERKDYNFIKTEDIKKERDESFSRLRAA